MTTRRTEGIVAGLATSATKGTIKAPVDRVAARRAHGIEGDAHAGPGPRQVSLLALPAIRRMEERFGEPLGIGRFGENLVVDGLDLVGTEVGDLVAVGNRVVLEVTAIGKECHLGCEIRRRTGDCIMPREGVFARVLLGGELAIGDGVQVVRPARDATVVVLAGGRSTRFGGDKRAALLGGADLLGRALATARAVTPNVLLSAAPGEAAVLGGRAPVVEDAVGGAGPLAGIVAGLGAATTELCAFLPADAPRIPADLLRALVALCGGTGAIAAGPRGLEPLVACWPVALRSAFHDALDQDRPAVRAAMAGLDPRRIGPEVLAQLGDPLRLLANVNTVEDLAALAAEEEAS